MSPLYAYSTKAANCSPNSRAENDHEIAVSDSLVDPGECHVFRSIHLEGCAWDVFESQAMCKLSDNLRKFCYFELRVLYIESRHFNTSSMKFSPPTLVLPSSLSA